MKRRVCLSITLGILVASGIMMSGCAFLADLDCSMEAGKRWAQTYQVRDGQCYIGPSALLYADPSMFPARRSPLFCTTTNDGYGGPLTTCQ